MTQARKVKAVEVLTMKSVSLKKAMEPRQAYKFKGRNASMTAYGDRIERQRYPGSVERLEPLENTRLNNSSEQRL